MNPQVTGPSALLSNAWKTYKDHWKLLVPIVILPSVGIYIAELMFAANNVALTILGVIVMIASWVFSIAMGPAVVSTLHRLSSEPAAVLTVKGQYKIGLSFFGSAILLAIIGGFVFIGSFFLFVIPAIIVGVYTFAYLFTLVIDDKHGFSAFTESYSLVRGRWSAVFGRLLIIGLVLIAIWLVLAGLNLILNLIFGIHVPIGQTTATLSIAQLAVSAIVSLIGTAIVVPLMLAYMYGLYLSLKATRQTEIQAGAFKKWLIALLIVGILGIPLIGILASVVLVSLNQARMQSATSSMQAQMQQ